MSVVASPYASIRLILNRILNRGHSVIQSSEDKIVIKINIHVLYSRIAFDSFLFHQLFSFCSILFLLCTEVVLWTKANRIGSLRAPLTAKRVFCSIYWLLTRYCLEETIFACVSVRRIPCAFFLREWCRRPSFIRLNSHRSYVTSFVLFHIPRFAMLTAIECNARIKILYDAFA